MKTLALLLVMISGGVAAAEPRFEVLDRGTAIEVIAYDLKAARTAVIPARSRLEVDLIGSPSVKPLLPPDKGVKVVELDGANPRRLSVKLPLERLDVKAIAKFAQAIQVGDDLHLLFSRDVPAEGARVVLPEPTLPTHIAAKLAAPVIGPQLPTPDSKPGTPPVAAVTDKTEGKPAPTTDALPRADEDKKSKDFLAPEESSSNFSMYAMGGLGAIALGLYLVKKKKSATAGTVASSIDVVATRSLGSKAKVVWLNAGGREMVVAVTPQAVRMLGQWKKSESPSLANHVPANMPFAQALENQQRYDKPRAATASPVAGILKLRERASTYEGLNEDIATGDLDADAQWAKEIFAASGGRK